MFAAKQPGYDPYPVLDQIFQRLAPSGIDGVELMHQALLHDDSVAKVRELSKRYSLPVMGSSWSAPMWDLTARDKTLAEGAVLIERVQAVGGTRLGISVGDARRKKTPQELDAQASCLVAVMRVCSDHGVAPNLHNHVYEVGEGEYDLSNTLSRVPQIGLGPDFGWLYRAKVDPVAFIHKYGQRIIYAHLRNELANGKWPETLSEGVIDYATIGKALHETGFSGALAIELAHEGSFAPTRSFGESVTASRAYVKQVMGY